MLFYYYYIKTSREKFVAAGKYGESFTIRPDYLRGEILCIQRYHSGVETVSHLPASLFGIIVPSYYNYEGSDVQLTHQPDPSHTDLKIGNTAIFDDKGYKNRYV